METNQVVVIYPLGIVQPGDVIRVPGMVGFRKVFGVKGWSEKDPDRYANMSRRLLVTVEMKDRIVALHNDTDCEFLIDVAA